MDNYAGMALWKEKDEDNSSSSAEEHRSKRKAQKEKKRKKEKKHKKEDHCNRDAEKSFDASLSGSVSSSDVANTTSNPVVLTSFSSFPMEILDQASDVVESSKSSESQREDWMLGNQTGFLFPSVTRGELRSRTVDTKAAARLARQEEVEKIYRSRELNPVLKDSTSDSEKCTPKVLNQSKSADVTTSPVPVVGDGGASWMKRAYRRMQEQSEETGRSLEDLAAERWGSLANLRAMIEAAEDKEYSRTSTELSTDHRSVRGTRDYYEPRRRYDAKDRDGNTASSGRSVSAKFVKPGEKLSDEWKNKDARKSHSTSKNESRKESKVDQQIQLPSGSKEISYAPTVLSDIELNQINARILRAELMGDAETVRTLKEKLANASKQGPSTSTESNKKQRENIVLTRTHASGYSYPVNKAPENPVNAKCPKIMTHNPAGERERYFADDDKYSLGDLERMERMQSAEDQNAIFARLAQKVTEKTDYDYGMDDAFLKKALNKESLDQMNLKDRDKAIMEHRQIASALSACLYCLEGPKFPKHLIIEIGKKVVLMLPPYASLTEGHCLLCPIQHVSSGTMLDEDVWEEMLQFRRLLCQMFEKQEMDCVFMETVLNLKSHPHMTLECIPLDKETGSTAPMYFKKAVMESEGEWTNNIKLIDLSKKDVRRAVPKTFPYFAVDFGMQGGYAHVIEDEKKFAAHFGREIVGGMIDAEPRLWLRNIPQNFNEQIQRVNKFSKTWITFRGD